MVYEHKCISLDNKLDYFLVNSDITHTFPELSNAAMNMKLFSSTSTTLSNIDFILDGEVMAFQNGKALHFQELQKRLHKKNLTEQIMSDIPLVYI